MHITQLPSILVNLPGGGSVHIAVQRWALERWEGAPDPPDLERTWTRKGKFTVSGRRSCAELAIVDHMRRDGWDGVWVNAYRNELRTEWFPAPAAKTLADLGAPGWATTAFEQLRAANGNKLTGFFDVFAWREPNEFWFGEAKVGDDRLRDNQREFIELALRFHQPEQFAIIAIAAGDAPAKVMFDVPGYPPAKSEALSMLGSGHSHASRVRLLLEHAAQARDEQGFQPIGSGRIALDVVVGAPLPGAPSDATNYLGGIADVLEHKAARGDLTHLGELADVWLYRNDSQIKEVSYHEKESDEAEYSVTVRSLP